MSIDPDQSVFLVSSNDPDNDKFGSSVLIHKDESVSYLLTCAHVVRDVGGVHKVKVDIHPAEIVAQGSDNYSDDLAVLRVNKSLGASILPLGNLSKRGSRFFTSVGWSLYDKRNKLFRLEPIQGRLTRTVKLKSREQEGFVDAWEINLDSISKLQRGHSGAPILDRDSRLVIGIISHREEEKTGLAISITILDSIWIDLPSGLIRETAYDLSAIRNLLKAVFNKDDIFASFCTNYFQFRPEETIPFLTKIEMLIEHCHIHNQMDRLLEYVRKIDEKHFNGFIPAIRGEKTKDGQRGFWVRLRHLIIFRTKRPIEHSERSKCLITLGLPDDFSKFTPEVRSAAIGALAGVLDMPKDDIRILEVRDGSIILKVELPSEALDRLILLYESDKTIMRDLGISYVMETFDEQYNLNNIRKLLTKGLTHKELVAFCNQNFEEILERLPSNSNKEEISDTVLEYVQQQSELSTLLNLAQEFNPKAYAKYRSYYNIPRKPFQKTVQKRSFLGLSRREFATATAKGVGLATGGSLLLSLVTFSLALATASVPDLLSLVTTFLYLILIPLGNGVGNVVANGANYKHSKGLGALAVFCYFVGYSLGSSLSSLMIQIIELIRTGEPEFLASVIASGIGFALISIVIQVFFQIFGALFNPLGSIGFLAGGYFAYKRAS